ncbi:MAG: hypothetical protein KDJ44_15350 [Rhodoblastus sp.]|nr:hypothetical protein [Rhodoblastus sp.]
MALFGAKGGPHESESHALETRPFADDAPLSASRRIVAAILLQDMQTRFGRSYFSYVVAVAWPLSHAVFIMGAYLLVNELAPVGDDPAIFALTGALPYILCFYPGRTMPIIFLQNRQLLNMPVVRPVHIMASALTIELLTGSIVLILILGGAVIGGVDIVPHDLTTASVAVFATLFLGVGVGAFNVICTAVVGPFYLVFYIVSMIGLYITSGVYVPTWMIPESTRRFVEYNPLFNLVEWMRSAYYASYDPDLVNKPLVLGTATVALFLGLLGERFLRNKFYV